MSFVSKLKTVDFRALAPVVFYGTVTSSMAAPTHLLATRNATMKKLFVGNLPSSTTDKELQELFSQFV